MRQRSKQHEKLRLIGIYVLSLNVNSTNCFYIGKSDDIMRRYEEHYHELQLGNYSKITQEKKSLKDIGSVLSDIGKSRLQYDVNDLGLHNMSHYILKHKMDVNYVDALEVFLIKCVNPVYNSQHVDKSKGQLVYSINDIRNIANLFDIIWNGKAYLNDKISKKIEGKFYINRIKDESTKMLANPIHLLDLSEDVTISYSVEDFQKICSKRKANKFIGSNDELKNYLTFINDVSLIGDKVTFNL